MSQISAPSASGKRNGVFASRPTAYSLLIIGAVLATLASKLRIDGIFSCRAGGYTSDNYLADCDGAAYGDYEHGAFWFNLEPLASNFATNAEALFLGNSRTQLAFSTPATAEWFSSPLSGYYLLGFGFSESSDFTGALLRMLRPRATVYIINVDGFFEKSGKTPIARAIMQHGVAERSRYEQKKLWQLVHKPICMRLAAFCGNHAVVFRSRQTGAWYMPENAAFKSRPVSYDKSLELSELDERVATGREFVSELPVRRECVILTMVPTVGTKFEVANTIAEGVGLTLVMPELDGLQTFDGSHLDKPSAERWSKAFFQAADSEIRKCLGKTQTSPK